MRNSIWLLVERGTKFRVISVRDSEETIAPARGGEWTKPMEIYDVDVEVVQ